MPRRPVVSKTYRVRMYDYRKIDTVTNEIVQDTYTSLLPEKPDRIRKRIEKTLPENWVVLNVSEPRVEEVRKEMSIHEFFEKAETIKINL